MNKRQITTQYCTILICLAIVSTLVAVATPFVTAFEMNLGIFSGSESGIDYIINIFEFEGESSEDNWFDEYENSDYTLIEGDMEKWIIRGLVVVLIVYAVMKFLQAVSFFQKRDQYSVVNQILLNIRIGFILNIAYYVFCMYIILKGHEWDFGSVLSGNVLVKTQTHIPMIIQSLIFGGGMFLERHLDRAMAGQVAPLNLGIGGIGVTPTVKPRYQTENTSQHTRDEMQKLELLKKYKELFDAGAINEEEYTVKKKEILGSNQLDKDRIQTEEEHREENLNQTTDVLSSCRKCGYPLAASQQVCSNCGTRTEEELTIEYGMKWYKFVIYFQLFATTAAFAISAFAFFTGSIYDWAGASSDLVYMVFPELEFFDFLLSLIFVGSAVLALVARKALKDKEKKGPILLCTLYASEIIFTILYSIVVFKIFESASLHYGIDMESFESYIVTTAVMSVISCIPMLIGNIIYFGNRKDIFVN